MYIDFKVSGNLLIANLRGELDHHSSHLIREKLDNMIITSPAKNIIFDLNKLEFMDSSGVGVLLGRYNRIMGLGGKAAICCSNSQIRTVIIMSGIERARPVLDDIDEARRVVAK